MFGWTYSEVADMTMPQMLALTGAIRRTSEEAAASVEQLSAHQTSTKGTVEDLRKYTAEDAAAKLRRYGFG